MAGVPDGVYQVFMVLAAVCLILAICMIPIVLRSKRRLDQRVKDFRRDIAECQGPPPDPWQELAEIYAAERRERASKRTERRGR
jgi:hypothetical protein